MAGDSAIGEQYFTRTSGFQSQGYTDPPRDPRRFMERDHRRRTRRSPSSRLPVTYSARKEPPPDPESGSR
jgi:hypothetical protein